MNAILKTDIQIKSGKPIIPAGTIVGTNKKYCKVQLAKAEIETLLRRNYAELVEEDFGSTETSTDEDREIGSPEGDGEDTPVVDGGEVPEES